MSRCIGGIVFGALAMLGLVAAPCLAQGNQQDQHTSFYQRAPKGFGFGVRITLQPQPGLVTFGNVPLALRTVPSNQSGPLVAGTPVTVPVSSFAVSPTGQWASISLAPQYSVRRFTVRIGVSLASFQVPSVTPTVDSGAEVATFPEVNQFGTDQRGVGTSLVYYTGYWDKAWSVSPFGELEFRLNRFVSVVGGYGGRKTARVTLESGYDQFDALSVYSRQTFASVTVKASLYGSVKFTVLGPHGGIFVGVMPVSTQLASPYPITSDFNGARRMQVQWGLDFAF